MTPLATETILKFFAESAYDFRTHACPQDESSWRFADWVEKFRFKHAVAVVLQPASILEIGVGYGYGARAFLDACPKARYTGVERQTGPGAKNNFGDWARTITGDFAVSFAVVEIATADALPGDVYDLVHIAGDLSGDDLYRCLELACAKARTVLVDELFATPERMQSAQWFLKKYSRFITVATTITQCGGQLLISVKSSGNAYFASAGRNYKELDASYDTEYYLTDCGGYDSFRKYGGRKLEDPRLLIVLALAQPLQGKRVLDLGCGRGELAYALAREGATVVAIDYSQDAIDIARTTFADENMPISFVHGDFFDLTFDEPFDCVIASDVVEHLEAPMLERMLARIPELLKESGTFIVHTAPNRLHLEYTNRQRRSIASQVGCYLPPNPRTVYEDLMHLNEQTPARLNRALRRQFAQALVWSTSLPDPVGSLVKPLNKDTLRSGISLFAVASRHRILPTQILDQLEPLMVFKQIPPQPPQTSAWLRAARLQTHLQAAGQYADAGATVTPMTQFPGILRWGARLLGKVIVYLARFITDRQQRFNCEIVAALHLLAEGAPAVPRAPFTATDAISPELKERLDAFYLVYENKYRGEQALIRERLKVYLPVIVPLATQGARFLDIGCGRGEWLDLIAGMGVAAQGIDLNTQMVRLCREKGHQVLELDARAYLGQLPEASIAVITAFHLVEHLPFVERMELLETCKRALIPGGMLILETPDPENIVVAASNFYYDPTHLVPLPDKSLQFLAEFVGFTNVEILKLHPICEPKPSGSGTLDEIQRRFFMAQDYGLICRKPA